MLIECYISVACWGFGISGTEIAVPYELRSVLNLWVLGFATALPNLQYLTPWGMEEVDLIADTSEEPNPKYIGKRKHEPSPRNRFHHAA